MGIGKKMIIVLLILNAIVLLGQIWPEGAPAFAVKVNIFTLILNLVLFVYLLGRSSK